MVVSVSSARISTAGVLAGRREEPVSGAWWYNCRSSSRSPDHREHRYNLLPLVSGEGDPPSLSRMVLRLSLAGYSAVSRQ